MTVPAGSTSALTQLRALIWLRMRMVRSRRGRLGFLLLALAVPASLLAAASAGRFVPPDRAFELSLLGPTLFLAFAGLSLLSPLTSGGGQEIYPPEQLVAYPIRPSTQFLGGLAVLPLNLAWMTQLLAVCAVAFLLLPVGFSWVPAAVVLFSYVVAVSAGGQLVTWWAVGLRRSRSGRRLLWGIVALVGLGTALLVRLVGATDLLDRSPTSGVFLAVVDAGSGLLGDHIFVTGTLGVIAVAGLAVGWRTCAWALRRTGDPGVFRESRSVARRPDGRVTLLSVDRTSIWRSPSLRRGVLVLGLLPGGISALLGIDWGTLVILPGLVAAGAALLFGVNAFCLDGTGAVWLASLPHDPALAIRAKTRILAEACLGSACLAVLAGLLTVERPPSPAEANGLACAVVVSVVCVVGTCLRYSMTRPHKAELRGPRDTPAPPGAMAAYSLRLAVGMTFLGLLLAGASRLDVWWLPWVVAAPALLLGLRRVIGAWALWTRPGTRAWVVMTVAHG